MSIEVSDYEPFTDAEIAAFHEDVRGVWQPSGTDQMRLLATIDAFRVRLAEAEGERDEAREAYNRDRDTAFQHWKKYRDRLAAVLAECDDPDLHDGNCALALFSEVCNCRYPKIRAAARGEEPR